MTKGRTRSTSTGGSGFVRSKTRPQRSMSGSFAKDGRSSSILPQRVVFAAGEESHARENRRELWKGCFAEPREFRGWNINSARLVGGGCQAGHENRTRDKLFRVDTAMPPGCPIKAKLALRAVGYEGIYHLRKGALSSHCGNRGCKTRSKLGACCCRHRWPRGADARMSAAEGFLILFRWRPKATAADLVFRQSFQQ